VKCKVVLGVLAAIGILALSSTAAQAGPGGIPSTLTGFFACHAIEGDDPGQNFDVESHIFGLDAFGNPIRQRVNISKGSLACAFAKLFRPGQGQPAIDPGTAEQMTCYPITPRRVDSTPPPDYAVNDPLFDDQLTIAVPTTALQYLCAPAGYFLAP
jgi:hypothetical protein